jgi:hypothetical protein
VKKMASTSAAPDLSTLAAEEAEAVARVRAQYAARRERLSARAGSAPADASALTRLLRSNGTNLRALFAQYDTNGDGHLSHREFMRAVAAASNASSLGRASPRRAALRQARHAAGNNRSAAICSSKTPAACRAPCGDGCLDKLPSSVRRAPALSLPVVGGRLRLPPPAVDAPPPAAAAPSGAFLLLGVMSGSAVRRAHLRCTWMQPEILRPQVRALFVVGKAAAEARPDVLPVDVQVQFAARRAILRRAILRRAIL